MQREGAMVEHAGREITHDRGGLDGEVAKHLIGAPAAKKADDVGVNLGAKEGHGARGAKGAGGDVFRKKTAARAHVSARKFECTGDVSGLDGKEPLLGCVINRRQRGLWGCVVLAQM